MLRRTCLAFIVLAMAVQMASGQEEGRRGRGGPGGPGGFGRRGGGPESGAMLLGMREVREELKVTPEQEKQVQELAEEMRGNFNFQELQDLSPEERRERLEKMRPEMEARAKQADEKLAKILDEKQMARLNQLRMQRQGVMALGRPEVGKQLGLSEEQQGKIRDIAESARPQFGGPGGRNFQDMSDEERREAFTKMQEQREKAEADVLAVLTDEQKTKWNELKGEKFEFPRGGFGGPGGRGGPGGGERRRPPRKQD